MIHDVLQPEGWAPPRGYANGIAARGRQVYVAGQVGWDAQGRFTSDSFIGQVHQALLNVVAVLAAAGAGPEHLVRLTWYVTSRDEYLAALPELGRVYREVLGRNYPAMAAVQVVALMEARAKVEIEATAVIPDPTEQS
jgi:enamine deaminase RidA (YjgF/YER057c/UK114 family)